MNEQQSIQSDPNKGLRVNPEFRVYWNNLRWGLMLAAGSVAMHQGFTDGPLYVSLPAGILGAGLAAYQIIKMNQFNAVNKERNSINIPCADCDTPCPLRDMKKQGEDRVAKSDQQQAALTYLTESRPELVSEKDTDRIEFDFKGYNRYLRLIVGKGKFEGTKGINCDMEMH